MRPHCYHANPQARFDGVRRAVACRGARNCQCANPRAACTPKSNGRRRSPPKFAASPHRGEPDTEETYYQAVLAALERLVGEKSPETGGSLVDRVEAWRRAYLYTPHGQPVPSLLRLFRRIWSRSRSSRPSRPVTVFFAVPFRGASCHGARKSRLAHGEHPNSTTSIGGTAT